MGDKGGGSWENRQCFGDMIEWEKCGLWKELEHCQLGNV